MTAREAVRAIEEDLMSSLFWDLKPHAPFRFFEEISNIPRPSFGEVRIADYLVDFATQRGLWCLRDGAQNVLIRKNGSPGRENEPAVLLQAHTDMVCEKHSFVAHDFEKDPIRLVREGDLLRADGTTLGGDDGFGVAVMLAVLDDGTLSHPPLECLFTSAEEVGLIGAAKFDYSHITAKRMLNLDSAEEHTVIVGCCGGERCKLVLPLRYEKGSGRGLRICLSGLCGGHSGEDIHRQRANAHVLMGKLLSALWERTSFSFASLEGGDKDTAIPRECTATVLPEDGERAQTFLAGATEWVAELLTAPEDRACRVTVSPVVIEGCFAKEESQKLLRVLSVRNGVLAMRELPPIMPDTSRNLASVRTDATGACFAFSSRSPKPRHIVASRNELIALADSLGGTILHGAAYPGWESAMDAPLVKTWCRAYESVTGRSCSPTLIHAGLECGLISDSVKGLAAISVGCNIHDLHTPSERIELSSMSRVYRAVLAFLSML